MPYRDRAHVESWLADFWDTHSLFSERLRILDDQFVPDRNSGVVVVALKGDPGVTYLSVDDVDGSPRWTVTFDTLPSSLRFDRDAIHQVAREINALCTLCDYLQQRTDEALQALDDKRG